MKQKILVTGAAGFVGFFLVKKLAEAGEIVYGIDNINDYYDIGLKHGRLKETGIDPAKAEWHQEVQSTVFPDYRFMRINLEDKAELTELCAREQFDVIVNLAAQAGVRYSIQNPDVYVQSNIVGFLNILEICRHQKVKHLVYASSSSVYGLNESMPFSVHDSAAHPVSLYAATKKANELMAHTYSHLYNIPTTGLRFFTVYGPWGRPDMAYFLFAEAIRAKRPIKVFNHGKMKRDFTYIDDIIGGIMNIIPDPAKADAAWDATQPDPSVSSAPYRVYNIGNNKPVELLAFIQEIEKNLGEKAIMEFMDIQDGDVPATWANVDELITHYDYKPDTPISKGIAGFAEWYKSYYKN
ncbi:MAG: NAD-dependent epimerase [Mucilaginibacter polytrichastri]|nr:NAD-dependent epimerase [Mucilaginibacter polytrichastri]